MPALTQQKLPSQIARCVRAGELQRPYYPLVQYSRRKPVSGYQRRNRSQGAAQGHAANLNMRRTLHDQSPTHCPSIAQLTAAW